MVRKAVVLARGLGTRMRRDRPEVELEGPQQQRAEAGLKALIPVNGRPFLDYVVDSLIRAGLDRTCLVIAPEADLMRREAERLSRQSAAEVACAVQDEPLGTADAVLAAQAWVGDHPFVLTNSDNLFPPEAVARVAGGPEEECRAGVFRREQLARRGNIRPERVRSFAVVRASEEGDLLGIVEKPSEPERFARRGSVLVSMNLYAFTPAVFESCRRIEPDPERGELELTAAVADLLDSGGVPFRVTLCRGPVFDLTSRADIAAVERELRDRPLCF